MLIGRTRAAGAIASVLIVAAAIAACDSVPGLPNESRPPRISGFSFSPDVVDLVEIPPEQIVRDTVRVPFTTSVTAADADGDLSGVGFVVSSPVDASVPVATGELIAQGGGQYRAETTLLLPAGEVGNYPVRVFAVDLAGSLSNQAHGIIRFGSTIPVGGPPVVEDVVSDPDIVRPPSTFRLIATVSDPDGLGNILRVMGEAPNGSEFQLFDDGETSGDDFPDDGLFTAMFDVPQEVCSDTVPPPCVTPGLQRFKVQAVDRSGNESNVFDKDVEVQ